MIASVAFGLSASELFIMFAAAVYVVSVVKDLRPVSALRGDKRQLAQDLAAAEERERLQREHIEQLERQSIPAVVDAIAQLAGQLTKLEHAAESLVRSVSQLESRVAANTAAVEVLSKRRVLDEALQDMEPRPA